MAAIKASSEIYIDAPIDKVWNVLVDLPSWPRFDPNFSYVKLESTVSVGAKASFRLYLEEALSGIFVPLMFSSARLLSQHQGWLHAIKKFIETI